MSKQLKIRVVTLAVIGMAFTVAVGRQVDWRWDRGATEGLVTKPDKPPDPVDAINRMMDAAREGDVNAYLANYSGRMEKMLRQNVSEMGAEGFSNYLKENNRQIKGFAMYEPRIVSDNEVEVRVEYVYADRNESQSFYLRRELDRWTITRLDSTERVETVVPYGTPVN